MKLFEQAKHIHNQLKTFEREHEADFIFEGEPYVFVWHWHYTDTIHVTIMRKPFSQSDYEHFIITPEQKVFSINSNGDINDDIMTYPLRTLQHRAALLEYAHTIEKDNTNETQPQEQTV